MSESGYIGVNGAAKKIGKYYVGVNGVAKLAKIVYVGNAENKAVRVFHEHGDWTITVVTAATCQRTGTRKYTCGLCSYSYTEVIPLTSHKYIGGYCKVCGAAKPGSITPITPTGLE